MTGAPLESPNAELAKHRALMLSRSGHYVGAIAFSRNASREPGSLEDVVVLRCYGETP